MNSFFFFFFFLERARKGEREEEKHRCVKNTSTSCLSHAPNWGLGPNPGMCPDQESNWWPFSSQASAQSIHWVTPARAKALCILSFILPLSPFYMWEIWSSEKPSSSWNCTQHPVQLLLIELYLPKLKTPLCPASPQDGGVMRMMYIQGQELGDHNKGWGTCSSLPGTVFL